MSEYYFGVGSGRVSRARAKRADRIAGKHGAFLVTVTLPGEGPRYWFGCRNRGAPFDGDTERAVMADLKAAGLWPLAASTLEGVS